MKKNFLLIGSLVMGMAANAQDSLTKEAAKTEIWEPVPKIVTPGNTNSEPPSDAIVLFDGKNADQWQRQKGGPAGWKVENGELAVVKGSGDVATKQSFGSCQLHIEWREPATIAGASQTRGNSGIFFMGKYELQVLDSYNNPTYVNGQAGSIYKQHIPLVNASKKPGEWQTYDVIFTAPKFNTDGSLQSPARITVLHNNVLVQNNVEIKGNTEWLGQPKYTRLRDKEPLVLQDHGRDGGQPMSYRNIWIREL
ncbi:DUF1080 domain-containing protein [Sediminibacterium roseum]|uniref:DUF1080 domain-containing protein n=1 Tax=Sediminibacterium roseum TaxID=1978412 RepID=A0ABX0A2D1_9BACT|nr:DUF1080 domain-containing protein [Sediminibacterium roseum]NCI52122.1 DUF1080 domain-containing protein [Sediminibacterium roseum]